MNRAASFFRHLAQHDVNTCGYSSLERNERCNFCHWPNCSAKKNNSLINLFVIYLNTLFVSECKIFILFKILSLLMQTLSPRDFIASRVTTPLPDLFLMP